MKEMSTSTNNNLMAFNSRSKKNKYKKITIGIIKTLHLIYVCMHVCAKWQVLKRHSET